ncbi:hypothetical protein [[Enterobacter] lignolyticus]|uniref:Uncharacterized protein n=1 Tax=[Enterobacter] lignolyticus TaxID=1334193 RepID=A0A806X8H7_9ENTR|nr:hypothetical protein [[Enterobacter] lignolyticus]ALR75097.1 hypothetical protein AO703_01840 [[Enterobacter] lignolyticus]
MNQKKWLLSFALILVALVLTMDIIALLTYFIAKVYLYFVRDIPFKVGLAELIRIVKGASFGGLIVGIGCWYVSFKHEW